jgi:hypothetical protein
MKKKPNKALAETDFAADGGRQVGFEEFHVVPRRQN